MSEADDPRHWGVLLVRPTVVELGPLARRFEGQVEQLDDGTSAVIWADLDTIEPVARLATALHASSDGEIAVGITVLSGLGPHATAELRSRALQLACQVGKLATPGVTLFHAPLRAVPSSVRYAVYGGLHASPHGPPLSIARLVEVSTATDRPRPLVVGRDAELAELRSVVTGAVGDRRGAVVLIRGEAGIGKTHLLGELRRMATHRGMSDHRAFNHEHPVGRSRDAIAVLVRSLLELPGAHPELQATALDDAMARARLHPDARPLVQDLLDHPLGLEAQRLFEAMDPELRLVQQQEVLRTLLHAATDRGPVLIELEDVHWATDECRHHLRAIAEHASAAPLVLAMTRRPSDDPPEPSWMTEATGPSWIRLDLLPLDEPDAQTVAAAVLSRRRAPWMLSTTHYVSDEAVLQCVERSGGNPLLLEQMLVGWEEGVDPNAPAPIAALVAARLGTLDPEDRRAVELASAYGTHFDLTTVSTARRGPRWDVGSAITAGLVVVEPHGHRFGNALVREAVYLGLSDADRRRHHRALARVIEDPRLRVEHLERADDPEAAPAHLEVARREHAAGRSSVALSHVERGLALSPRDGVRFQLLQLAGRIHVDRGRPEPALDAYARAAELAGTPLGLCRARLGSVSALRLQSRHVEAAAPLQEAEQLAIHHGNAELIGLAAFYRGCLQFAQGNVKDCTTQHERAVYYARLAAQPRTEALALSGLGDAHFARSRIRSAREVLERCIELSRAHGFGRIEVGNLFMLGALRALEDDVEGGRHACIEAARMAARVGNRRAEMLANLNAGICSTVQGRPEDALHRIRAAMRMAEPMDSTVFRGTILAFEARAQTLGSDQEAALRCARESLELGRPGALRFFGGVALGALARAAAPSERDRALAEGEQLLATPCPSHNYVYFYEDAIEVWLEAEQWDRAEHGADVLDTVDAEEPFHRCRVLSDRARALAQLGRDPTDEEAAERARAVLGEIRRVGLQPLQRRLEDALATARGGTR